jgi:hypothetical protein
VAGSHVRAVSVISNFGACLSHGAFLSHVVSSATQRKVPLLPPQSKEKEGKGKAGAPAPAKAGSVGGETQVNPVLAGILQRTTVATGASSSMSRNRLAAISAIPTGSATSPGNLHALTTPQQLARAAAGHGIRHSFLAGVAAAVAPAAVSSVSLSSQSVPENSADTNRATRALQEASFSLPASASLSQLELNFRNTINDMDGNSLLVDADPTPLNEMIAPQYGFLSRDSSLIDLAMIPPVEDNANPSTNPDTFGLTFDFPDPDDRKPSPAAQDLSQRTDRSDQLSSVPPR